jgi:hypothetical protein
LHGLNNKQSNHSLNKKTKERVLKLAKEKCYDFNPTLMKERLNKEENIKINKETLRLRLKKNKLISKLRKKINGRRRQNPIKQKEKKRNTLERCYR